MSFHYLLRKLHHANSLQKCPKNDTPKQIKLKDIYIYIFFFICYKFMFNNMFMYNHMFTCGDMFVKLIKILKQLNVC